MEEAPLMSWPGHDDAPHFQISRGKPPRLKWTTDTLSVLVCQNRRVVIIFLSAAVIAGLMSVGPKIKTSIIRTLESVGQSAQLQGRAFIDVTQKSAAR
jgi:hypothetical protein